VPALLDADQHERGTASLELSAPTESSLGSPDPGIVDLNLSLEWFARRIDHRSPELMEHQPSRFVPMQPQLTLEEQRGNPSLVGGHQIRGPEPHRERDLRVMQNRPGRQGHLVSAGGTLPVSAIHEGIGVRVPASGAGEALGPPTHRQVFLAGFVSGELTLKFGKVSGKGRARHTPILYRGGS